MVVFANRLAEVDLPVPRAPTISTAGKIDSSSSSSRRSTILGNRFSMLQETNVFPKETIRFAPLKLCDLRHRSYKIRVFYGLIGTLSNTPLLGRTRWGPAILRGPCGGSPMVPGSGLIEQEP